eukprot:761611-Hanusia_phi.AAC.2
MQGKECGRDGMGQEDKLTCGTGVCAQWTGVWMTTAKVNKEEREREGERERERRKCVEVWGDDEERRRRRGGGGRGGGGGGG